MCILCVIQKWSRQVATMLPWFVIPLIGLWALSQLLPPAFRFEITSPRLACVFVLLVTLFWYEVLMPQLSTWRVRRNARLRERARLEAIELQKLKKNATRRCRNCSTPYRDQNPGGGKFMCSYCGHVSKRPVLDMPGLEISGSGILKELVGRGGKILNGKGWGENGCLNRQEWCEGSTLSNGSSYWRNSGGGTFDGDENCLVETSYPGGVVFACRLLTSLFMSIRWLWRKIFRFSSVDDSSLDPEQRRLLAKQGENGSSYHESRIEKARRKAEEKRQARLEKELSEEEERKQREEVARLVEERRKLRDEKIEAEKCSKVILAAKEKIIKEAEKKRQERRKEREKASIKSSSDGKKDDKRTGKETEHKRNLDKNDHLEHDVHAHDKGSNMERRHGVENNATSNSTKSGGRYFDRMKGTILSSSKAFSDSRLFGRGVTTSSTIAKENKPIGSADNSLTSAHTNPPEVVAVKSFLNEMETNANPAVVSEPKPASEPRKAWHQLFARSTPVPLSSNDSTISRPNSKPQEVSQSSHVSTQVSPIRTFDNPISFGLPSPFAIPECSSRSTSSLGFSPPTEIAFPQPGEDEHFEDPCYVPDPISLLGPVSKSLDLRAGYEPGIGLAKHRAMKNSPACEISKPSPIESPLSKSRAADEKQANDGSWQMWKSPLGQTGLGLVGGSANWIIPSEAIRTNEESGMHHVPQHLTSSLFSKEDAYSHRDSPESDHQNGVFSPITGSSSNHDPWSQNMFFPALSGTESPFSYSIQAESILLNNRSPTGSARDNPFEHPSPNHWLKKVKGSGDGTGK
ncbi:unnamed protein product [Eruca vesicaria subsp. sativa]|uniref:Stress response NST1-like protein n=1 Tax=Eruca vesicaria subsp. sativa TaxID=29727 RepID=A0ABC8KHY3_ERUVS|nr:unnamed protein product [Eruca vesicaria subsp. sativa]